MGDLKNEVREVLKGFLGAQGYEKLGRKKEEFIKKIFVQSLLKAGEEQNLDELVEKLRNIVPDISDKETGIRFIGNYYTNKVYYQYAFQMTLLLEAVKRLREEKKGEKISYVDVGDSSGNHIQFLKGLVRDLEIETVSINIDSVAVEKVKKKGLKAIQTPVEKIEEIGLKGDILGSYQMLEHLHDPATFMYKISALTSCRYFVATVPYLKESRVGMHYIRYPQKDRKYFAQDVHIFELSPQDWILLFRHAGWRPTFQKTYLQYPLKHYLRSSRRLWKKVDYEGFWGVILERDDHWAKLYKDWGEIASS